MPNGNLSHQSYGTKQEIDLANFGRENSFEDQIHLELFLLRRYVEYCDDIGIRIPNDSLNFRSRNLMISGQDRYYLNLERVAKSRTT